MNSSKFIQLLRTFQARDLRRFGEYLDSPYFNKREDLRSFYQLLLQFSPNFDLPEPEIIWEKYAGKVPFESKTMAYLQNFLLSHAENYLAIEQVESDPTAKGTPQLRHYLEHGLEKHYRAVYRRSKKALLAEPYRDSEWHLKAWRLADIDMQFFYSSRDRKQDNSIGQVLHHLDTFYFNKKLASSTELLNLGQILQEEHDTSFIPALVDYLEANGDSEPTVRIRKLVLELLRKPEKTESFFELTSLLPAASRSFPPERVKEIFGYAQNYCIRRIKAGDEGFRTELFDLYRGALKTGLLFENGELNPWSFKNICSVALGLGEFSWVEDFIREQQNRLPAHQRKNGVAFNLANLNFHRKNHGEALKFLREVEFTDIFYALDTRRMMLMIYLERDEETAFEHLLASFRVFLRRNKVISEGNRKAYGNFLQWAGKIFKARANGNSRELLGFRDEIARESLLVEREWLLQKCA